VLTIVRVGGLVLQQVLNQQIEILTLLTYQAQDFEACGDIAQTAEGVAHHHGKDDLGLVDFGDLDIEQVSVQNNQVGRPALMATVLIS